MAFRIEERFAVHAPVDAVWAYLIDPRRVVTCLPGAELTEIVDPHTFLGNVKVKVGPATMAYKGRVQLTEVDEGARRVRLLGEGRESAGAGSAKMRLESTVAAGAAGETEVTVHVEVDVAGRAVQLGRGLIEQVSVQLFRQFAACVRTTLEAGATAQPQARPPEGVTSIEAAPAAMPGPARPVRAVPLLWRAVVAAVAGFFRRLFGTGSRQA